MSDVRHTTDSVLMIEPVRFHPNAETFVDNAFQVATEPAHPEQTQKKALAEFNTLRALLEGQGVKVTLFQDVAANETPDSIFPNNWFSTHEDSRLVVYSMMTPNRRREKRADIIQTLRKERAHLLDLSAHESDGHFLEGTGSLVLDRAKRIAYASLSYRTHPELLALWAKELGYNTCTFTSYDASGLEIYHTNCMMSLGSGYAVVCFDAVRNENERKALRESLVKSGIEPIDISLKQVLHYCANCLELKTGAGKPLLVMSENAFTHLEDPQLKTLSRYVSFLHCALPTIEQCGGGSARCMLAELY